MIDPFRWWEKRSKDMSVRDPGHRSPSRVVDAPGLPRDEMQATGAHYGQESGSSFVTTTAVDHAAPTSGSRKCSEK
jgi:hypothetical protein